MIRMVIVRPTTYCNLKCKYCYVNEKVHILSEEKINSFINSLSCIGASNLSLLYHGGEPLSIGIDKFKKIHKQFKNSGLFSSYFIQTNLIDTPIDMIDYLINQKIKIGSSLDGPFEIHTKLRPINITQYNNLIKNIIYIRERQKSLGIVCVVSKYNKNYVKELCDFYENLGINVRFNIVSSKNDFCISFSEYYSFLLKILNYWIKNYNSKIMIEPVSSDLSFFAGEHLSMCNKNFRCGNTIICLNADGLISRCSRLSQQIHTETELHHLFTSDDEIPKASCAACEVAKFCGGGCMHEQLELGKDSYCIAMKNYVKGIKNIYDEICQ